MIRATDLAQQLLSARLTAGSWVVDATAGNGHDTLFLAQQVGIAGQVYAFDIQASALATAQQRCAEHPQITWVQRSHAMLRESLPEAAHGRLAAVMFNLGYLPGGEKDTITQPQSTMAAIAQALAMLAKGGMMTVILYPGHEGGNTEAAAVMDYLLNLKGKFSVYRFQRLNAIAAAPELVVVET